MSFLLEKSLTQRLIVGFVLLCFVSSGLAPIPAMAQPAASQEDFSVRMDRVYKLRFEGEFDQAIGELRKMMEEYANADKILRELHNELVKTIHIRLNATSDEAAMNRLEREREDQAKVALLKYPDLEAGAGFDKLDELYSRLRGEMFGALEIKTSPDSCDVFIDEKHFNKSPFYAQYFLAGAHKVRLAKNGYEESVVTIEVPAGGNSTNKETLKKIRGRMWWLTRVAAPVTAGVGLVLALALSGGDEASPPVEPDKPLPGPPDPPTN